MPLLCMSLVLGSSTSLYLALAQFHDKCPEVSNGEPTHDSSVASSYVLL